MSSTAGLGLDGLRPVERKEYSAPVFSTLPKVDPKKARWVIVLSHWAKLLEGLQASPLDLYGCVEEAIHRRDIPLAKECRVEWHEGGILSAHRQYLRIVRGEYAIDICGAPFGTGFFVSYWFVYQMAPVGLLTLLGLLMAMPVLAFPFYAIASLLFNDTMTGGLVGLALAAVAAVVFLGLLIRHWNEKRPGWDFFLMQIPILGPIYRILFRPFTYYKVDTAVMFHRAVHYALMEVINGMTKAKGIRPLTELEQKPIMREFFQPPSSRMDHGW